MEQSLKRAYLLLAGAVVLLIVTGSFIHDMVSTPGFSSHDTPGKNLPVFSGAMERIDKALTITVQPKHFEFVGKFDNPFRLSTSKPVRIARSGTRKKAAPARKKLIIKGILMKGKPLAIFEDEEGQTFIRGIGELVHEQKVLKITENRVVLHDRRGTYDISVEE